MAETLYYALDVLAQVAPDWLQLVLQPEWFERYSQRPTSYRMPRKEAEQLQLADQVGRDGWHLLQQIWLATAPGHLRTLPAVESMRQIWLQNFYIDGEMLRWREEQNCPPCGKRIISPYEHEAIQIRFSKSDCLPCPARGHCTKSESGPRSLTILPQLQQEALQSARQRQAIDDFKAQYTLRSGIEGTIALATNKLRMRRSCHRSAAKTHLHHLLTAAAINLMRSLDWIGQVSRSTTHSSHLLALKPVA